MILKDTWSYWNYLFQNSSSVNSLPLQTGYLHWGASAPRSNEAQECLQQSELCRALHEPCRIGQGRSIFVRSKSPRCFFCHMWLWYTNHFACLDWKISSDRISLTSHFQLLDGCTEPRTVYNMCTQRTPNNWRDLPDIEWRCGNELPVSSELGWKIPGKWSFLAEKIMQLRKHTETDVHPISHSSGVPQPRTALLAMNYWFILDRSVHLSSSIFYLSTVSIRLMNWTVAFWFIPHLKNGQT